MITRDTVADVVRLAIYSKFTELIIRQQLRPGAVREALSNGLRVEPARTGHATLLRRFNETYRTRKKAIATEQYMACGYRGFVGFVGTELIGYWWCVDRTVEPRLTHPCIERYGFDLSDDAVFAIDYFIAPGHREHGAAVKFLALAHAELARLGYRAVWAMVDVKNIQARWLYRALGATVVRRVVSHRFAGTLLYHDGRLYVRNTRWNRRHSFNYRRLFSLKRPATCRGGEAPVHEATIDRA